jgi:hypothetical protein
MTVLSASHSLVAMTQLHAPELSASGATEIALLAVGLHAARTKTPFMTLRGRTASALASPIDSGLRKAPQMRSTLHYMAENEFPEFHAATVRQRLKGRHSSLRRHGLTVELVETLRSALLDRLPPGKPVPENYMLYLASDVVKGRWKTQTSPSHMAWQLIRLIWDCADVKMLNNSTQWLQEHRMFTRCEGLRVVDESQARIYVLKRYIEAYGPVTAKDVVWWTAFEASDVAKSLRLLVRDGWLQMVICPEFGVALYRCFEPRAVVPAVERSFEERPIFLAYEDPFVKAYFETRFRYANPAAIAAVFHKTGEARASVMWRGRIRGVWEFGGSSKPSILIMCPKLGKKERQLLSARWKEQLRGMGASELVIDRSPVRISRTSYE